MTFQRIDWDYQENQQVECYGKERGETRKSDQKDIMREMALRNTQQLQVGERKM